MKTDLSCALSDLSNCLILSQDNTCIYCADNYYLDNATKKCVAVDNAKKVANCLSYDSAQNCSSCAKNFLKTNNTCVAITTVIANCGSYSSQTECGDCDINYYLAEDKKSCKALPTDCLGYSLTTCKSCQPGYIINYNLYKKNFYKFTVTSERNAFDLLFKAQKNNWRFESPLDFCEPVVATNCATLASFNLCASCADGYYLDSTTKVCTLFPEPIIPNCNIYAYDDIFRWKYKCVSCKENYFLKDKKTC